MHFLQIPSTPQRMNYIEERRKLGKSYNYGDLFSLLPDIMSVAWLV